MTARVWVVGSANVDRTIRLDAVPGPGETVLGGPAERGPGGKGLNQAVASARMGVPTAFVGAIGDDPDGEVLLAVLAQEGIDSTGTITARWDNVASVQELTAALDEIVA